MGTKVNERAEKKWGKMVEDSPQMENSIIKIS